MLTSLPPELLEIIVQDCLSASSVESIAHVATLGATCRILRCAVDQVGAPVLREHSVASLEHLAVAIAIKGSAMTDGNTSVGFEFASVSIARENGAGSRVKGSRARIATFAAVLRRHRRATIVIDAHCGPTAPPSIAKAYSMQRGHAVASELTKLTVCSNRLSVIGHGKAVSASAAVRDSSHAHAASAHAGFGWADMSVFIDGRAFPQRPDYYPSEPPPPATPSHAEQRLRRDSGSSASSSSDAHATWPQRLASRRSSLAAKMEDRCVVS